MFDVFRGENVLLLPFYVDEFVEIHTGIEEVCVFGVSVKNKRKKLHVFRLEFHNHFLSESNFFQEYVDF